ncbi:MAG: hypothetical protein U0946_03650 [Patescibacteria group bacterium]|nr:hypothetical protein [Patescibacteria group bacterium]
MGTLGLLAYGLLLLAIRFFKSGIGGVVGAWPLYLGVLAGSQFGWLDGWVRRYLPHKLFTQNVLFMPVWLILAVFAFTSITGWFGKGLILGIGLQQVGLMVKGLKAKGQGLKVEWIYLIIFIVATVLI